MKNIEEINRASIKKILTTRKIPEFFPGDTIKVGVKITEGKSARISEKIKKKIGVDVSEQPKEQVKVESKKEDIKKEDSQADTKKEKLKTEKK